MKLAGRITYERFRGEDFSLVIRAPRRLRIARGRIHVLQ